MTEQENLHPRVDHILTPADDDSPEARAERMMGNDVLREMLAGTAWEEELELMVQNGEVESLDNLRRAAINLASIDSFLPRPQPTHVDAVRMYVKKLRSTERDTVWMTNALHELALSQFQLLHPKYPEDPYHNAIRQFPMNFPQKGQIVGRIAHAFYHFSPHERAAPMFFGSRTQTILLSAVGEACLKVQASPAESTELQAGRAMLRQLTGCDNGGRPVSFKELAFGYNDVEQLEMQSAVLLAVGELIKVPVPEQKKKVGDEAVKNAGVKVKTKVKAEAETKAKAKKKESAKPSEAHVTTPKRVSSKDEGPKSGLGRYYWEICKVPLLTAEQEVELAKKIEAGLYATHLLEDPTLSDKTRRDFAVVAREGEAAKQRFISSNLRLVLSIARRHRSKLPILDVVQEGNFGLVRAIEKFDYTQGTKFSTYATRWIRQFMRRAEDNSERVVRISVGVEEQIAAVKSMQNNLTTELNRSPTYLEVSVEMGISEARVIELLGYDRSVIELDRPFGAEENASTMGDLIASKTPGPEEIALNNHPSSEVMRLRDAMDDLDEQEKKAIALFFGFDDGNPKSYRKISLILNIAEREARRAVQIALAKLRSSPLLQDEEFD